MANAINVMHTVYAFNAYFVSFDLKFLFFYVLYVNKSVNIFDSTNCELLHIYVYICACTCVCLSFKCHQRHESHKMHENI